MSQSLLVVGLSHRSAPIEIRERFVLTGDHLGRWVDDLVTTPAVSECVVLSTCNRTECYLAGPDADDLEHAARRGLGRLSGLGEEAERYLLTSQGLEAVRHLFRVVSGLDSLIIGEPQIQGQVSAAYRESEDHVLGPALHRLFQSALAAGGRVRASTSITRGATSIPSAAVNLATKVFGLLADRAVMVVGTGEMGQLTVQCLRREGVRRVYVASRNPARAERVGRAIGASPMARSAALGRLDEMDLIITCTESEAAFVTPEHLGDRAASGPPLVILDIAVPRNVDSAAGEASEVFLYNVDDLQRVVDQAQEAREFERERAEAIIDRHVERFWSWHRSRVASPTIRALRIGSRRIVDEALTAARAPGPRDVDVEEDVRLATRTALNKILHGPTRAVRWLTERSDADECLKSLEPWLEESTAERTSRGIAEGGLG